MAKTIALALGAGGARGLAHIAILEALDELGLVPCAIAGSSMGAILGACYAAGMSGRDLRHYVYATTRDKTDVMARLLRARIGRLTDLFTRGVSNPVLLDGEVFLEQFWPRAVPEHFEQLKIPFTAVATDFYTHHEAVFRAGPLRPAVAGSMAIPGLIKPVPFEAQMLIDGGVVNPLPTNHVKADMVIAVDVGGSPILQRGKVPDALETVLGAAQIMQSVITREKLRQSRPTLLLRAEIDQFKALDFFKARDILKAAEPMKEEIKRALDARFEASGQP